MQGRRNLGVAKFLMLAPPSFVQVYNVGDRVLYTRARLPPVVANVGEVYKGAIPYYSIMTSAGRELAADGSRLEHILQGEREVG